MEIDSETEICKQLTLSKQVICPGHTEFQTLFEWKRKLKKKTPLVTTVGTARAVIKELEMEKDKLCSMLGQIGQLH